MDRLVVSICDTLMANRNTFRVRKSSKTAMIVDGWTQDWHFPNFSTAPAYRYDSEKFPAPLKCALGLK